jgi:uncharacterized coiled-coil protein SlyX
MKTCDSFTNHPYAVVTWDTMKYGENCPLCRRGVPEADGDSVKDLKIGLADAKTNIDGLSEQLTELSEELEKVNLSFEEIENYVTNLQDAVERASNGVNDIS